MVGVVVLGCCSFGLALVGAVVLGFGGGTFVELARAKVEVLIED